MTDDALAVVLSYKREMRAIETPPDSPTVDVMIFRAGLAVEVALRALAAVEAALAIHAPVNLYGPAADEDHPDACPHSPAADWDVHFECDAGSMARPGLLLCGDVQAGRECQECETEWPCPTYEAIQAALNGKGAGNAD